MPNYEKHNSATTLMQSVLDPDAKVKVDLDLPEIGDDTIVGYLTDEEIQSFRDMMSAVDSLEELLEDLDEYERMMYGRVCSSPSPADIGQPLVRLMGRNPAEYTKAVAARDRVLSAKRASDYHTVLYSAFWYELRKRLPNAENISLVIREGFTICNGGTWVSVEREY